MPVFLHIVKRDSWRKLQNFIFIVVFSCRFCTVHVVGWVSCGSQLATVLIQCTWMNRSTWLFFIVSLHFIVLQCFGRILKLFFLCMLLLLLKIDESSRTRVTVWMMARWWVQKMGNVAMVTTRPETRCTPELHFLSFCLQCRKLSVGVSLCGWFSDRIQMSLRQIWNCQLMR